MEKACRSVPFLNPTRTGISELAADNSGAGSGSLRFIAQNGFDFRKFLVGKF